MYLIISERKKATFYRSTDEIHFVSGFLGISVDEIQKKLEKRAVERFVLAGVTHVLVDVDKCSFKYSVDSNILHNLEEEQTKTLEDYIEEYTPPFSTIT